MQLDIEYLDQNRQISQVNRTLSFVRFLKHASLAGQGFLPSLLGFKRALGFLFFYSGYLNLRSFNQSRFSMPSPIFYDPTEKGQFSNLVGKAIADFLAKDLSNGIATFPYEAAMVIQGYPVSVGRPDLYCISKKYQFAVEAKGLGDQSVSAADLLGYKAQAQSGPLAVNFSCASIAYNLYQRIGVKYHDPLNENVVLDAQLHNGLLELYYSDLRRGLNSLAASFVKTFEHQNRQFAEIDLFKRDAFRLKLFNRVPRLLIDRHVDSSPTVEALSEYRVIDDDEVFVDSDGIGFRI